MKAALALVGALLVPFWPASAAPPAPDYELLFADEFEGGRVDETHWMFRTGRRTASWINGLNLARNVTVADGHLIVTARQEVIDGQSENTGGGVISRHRFGFGYYECRSRPFMAGKGVHTAFWQRGLENNSLFEIDSHEIDSTQPMACNNLYVSIAPKVLGELPWPHRAHVPLKLPPDGWWIDAYEFTPEGVIFYDQGKIVERAEFPDLIAAQNVWLTALNGAGKVDAAKQPGETRFDYFRYYARDYPGVNLLPNGSFEYNLDKVDPQKPLAWTETGDPAASHVERSPAAAHGAYVLRHSADRAYHVATSQTLEYLRNGDYELLARVRRVGAHTVARLRVRDTGAAEVSVDLPLAPSWQLLHLPRVTVANHRVTLTVESAGGAGDQLEVDDLQFMKPPLPGQARRPSRVIGQVDAARDPIWQIARHAPLEFSGDDKFYFFSRNVGSGDAMTVTFVLNARTRSDTIPIARQPKTGRAGWAIRLSSTGDLAFCLGSAAEHREIIARDAYTAGRDLRITCTFERGTARIFLDGALRQSADGIAFTPADTTAPGRLGASQHPYEVTGDITLATATGESRRAASPRLRNFSGTVRDLRIYNRALASGDPAL